jgi:hypothetical protein
MEFLSRNDNPEFGFDSAEGRVNQENPHPALDNRTLCQYLGTYQLASELSGSGDIFIFKSRRFIKDYTFPTSNHY